MEPIQDPGLFSATSDRDDGLCLKMEKSFISALVLLAKYAAQYLSKLDSAAYLVLPALPGHAHRGFYFNFLQTFPKFVK